MMRPIARWAAAAVLLVSTGCTMCARNYDECGPVYDNGACTNCTPGARMNSILAPGGMMAGAPMAAGPMEALPEGAVMMGSPQRTTAPAEAALPAPAPRPMPQVQGVPQRAQPQPY